MHFFITGHTGFKGSWMTLLLKELGHEVSGLSLEPQSGGLFEKAGIESMLTRHFIGDIRDSELVEFAITDSTPDVAIHMAAQPLVLKSYTDPVETFTTNVDGTRNFLSAITSAFEPPLALVVTTDKVYRGENIKKPYVEGDPIGGRDPYSASKAMADILTQSWAHANPSLEILVARAGNVIGAFDVSENRLVPDIIRAYLLGKEVVVRNPSAIRPWQHVLDCISGYLTFILSVKEGLPVPRVLNFGPENHSLKSVEDVVRSACGLLPSLRFRVESPGRDLEEAEFLALNSHQAQSTLGWRNLLSFETALSWSLAELENVDPLQLATQQVHRFLKL